MTHEQWIQAAIAYWHMYPEQRKGQAFFNSLALNRPDLSEQIRGTNLDPFYREADLQGFMLWVDQNW